MSKLSDSKISVENLTGYGQTSINSPSRKNNINEVKALTGLRGIAAFDVMLGHFNMNNIYYLSLFIFHDAAVDVFFALSSFTLFLVYRTSGPINWRSFAVSRFARVYPLYFLVTWLGVYLNAYGQLTHLDTPGGHDMMKHLASQLLMTAQLPIPSISGFYIVALWSVPIEVFCYIVLFPTLRWLSPHVRSPSNLLLSIIAAPSIVLMLYVMHFNPAVNNIIAYTVPDIWSYWLPIIRGTLMFIAGWAVFKVYEQDERFADVMGMATNSIALLMLIVIVLGEVLGMIRKEAIVILAPLLIAGLMNPDSLTARILAFTPIHYLGRISFSVYLLHLPVYIIIMHYFPSLTHAELPRIGIPVVATLLVSTLSYATFENPARRIIRWTLRGYTR